ncbi:hypothetical protein BKA81DRAFT_357804 [Phyllosticta paracitricarpa]|uniref:Uncharacterized protein n=1 Tax=Phyllosticta paracitricarpa TaxID=2016321 RepID=A0ABR1NEU7_9PEZI
MSLGVFFLFDVLSFLFFFSFLFFSLFFDYYYVLHAYDCYTCVDAACGSISKEQRSGCLFLVQVVCLSRACCHEEGTLFHVPPVLFSPNCLRLPLPFPSLPQTATITTTTTAFADLRLAPSLLDPPSYIYETLGHTHATGSASLMYLQRPYSLLTPMSSTPPHHSCRVQYIPTK